MKQVIFLLTIMLFTSGCFGSDTPTSTFFKNNEVLDYFASIPNIEELASDLNSKDFKIQDVIAPWQDSFNIQTPSNILLFQLYGTEIDCSNLFLEYCYYLSKADEVIQILTYKDLLKNEWKFYSKIRVGQQWYLQSGLYISKMESADIDLRWIDLGYKYNEVIRRYKWRD